jgi:hypothetical protein
MPLLFGEAIPLTGSTVDGVQIGSDDGTHLGVRRPERREVAGAPGLTEKHPQERAEVTLPSSLTVYT